MSILRVFHNSTDILSNVKTGSYTTVMPDSDTQIYVKSTDQDKPVVTIVRDTYNSYHFEVTDNVSIQQYCHTTGADASGCTWMDINQSKVSTIATGVKYNDNSTSQTISDTAPQTWSVYVRDAAGNVSDKVAGTSTISSYAVTRSRTVTDGSASDITLTIRYDATSDDSSKPNFADDSKTMYMLHGTPIYIVASAGSGFTLTELKLNDTDILSNKAGYRYDIVTTTAVISKAIKSSIHGITTMQQMTSLICSNTTTPKNTATLYDLVGEHEKDTNYVQEVHLSDVRDNKIYVVRKLADGQCWMTQNIGLVGGTKINSSYSNVSSDFQLPSSSTAGFDNNNYYNAKMYNGSHTNASTESVGAHYSANAAMVNLAKNPLSGDRLYDICPKSWIIPNYTQFYNLVKAYGAISVSSGGFNTSVEGSAFFTQFGVSTRGYWTNNTNYNTGNGDYWGRTPSNSTQMLRPHTSTSSGTKYAGVCSSNLFHGFSVRCTAK